MLQRKSAWWAAGVLAGGLWMMGQPATAQPASSETPVAAADRPAAQASKNACDCPGYGKYNEAEAAPARALFDAVTTSDEAAFVSALAGVEHPGAYAQDGRPLLHTLLTPPGALRSKHVYWDMDDAEKTRIRTAYQAVLPARTRMLAALLATRPALNDVTYNSRRTALQLALLYGTPEMLDMLLAAGADPDQANDENRTPLEFLLNRDFEFAVRMTYLPRLPNRADTTRMVLALFKAGAKRPFSSLDASTDDATRQALTDEQGVRRPAADFLAWNPLVELTEGAEPLRALAATGSKPGYEDGISAMALAAYVGNAGAVQALMELGPRTWPEAGYGATGDRDAWLDAAQAAVIAGHPDIAATLLGKGMPFAQSGPQTSSFDSHIFVKVQANAGPIMNLAAERGDVATLRRLIDLGAPVDGDASAKNIGTPLADAVQARKPEAVHVLLAAGADPALRREGYDQKSALELAIESDDPALLGELLAAAKPAALKALFADAERSPLPRIFSRNGDHGVVMLRQLVEAGLDVTGLDAGVIRRALENRDAALAAYLIDAGVPVNPPEQTAPPQSAYDDAGTPPLLVALRTGQTDIVDKLLDKGADPLALEPGGRNALYGAIRFANGPMLERLLKAGAKLDDPRLPRAPAAYALLNAAVASGDIALVQRVSQATGQKPESACLTSGAESTLLNKPGYFAALQAEGFTGAPAACVREEESLPSRVLSVLLQGRTFVWARRDTVVDVLTRLRAAGLDWQAPMQNGSTPLNIAIEQGRLDLVDAFVMAGASPDAPDGRGRGPAWVALETGQPDMLALLARHKARFDKAAAPEGQSFEKTLACQASPVFAQTLREAGVTLKTSCKASAAGSPAPAKRDLLRTLAGHYYLKGQREVGSELLLAQDGRFEYLMMYGAVDVSASGTWRSDGQQVFLDTPPIQPFSAIAAVRPDPQPGDANALTVRVYYQGRPVKVDVAMSTEQADYAGESAGRDAAHGVMALIEPGALKRLAVYVPLPSGERWHAADLTHVDPLARALRVDLDLPEAAGSTPLHMALEVQKNGALVVTGSGGRLRYEKE